MQDGEGQQEGEVDEAESEFQVTMMGQVGDDLIHDVMMGQRQSVGYGYDDWEEFNINSATGQSRQGRANTGHTGGGGYYGQE